MSIEKKIKEINNMFEVFDNSMDKYVQIIEFGKKNTGLSKEDKNNNNKINGCASQAWVKTEKLGTKYLIKTDSDTFIVKGLLNILEYIVSNSFKEEILQLEIKDFFRLSGLSTAAP